MSVCQTALHYAVSATQEEVSCTCAVAVGLAGQASISQGDDCQEGGGVLPAALEDEPKQSGLNSFLSQATAD